MGFQSHDEEAVDAGGAAEGQEHLGEVGAPAEEELPLAPGLSLAPENSPQSKHLGTETSLTDFAGLSSASVSAPWPTSWTSSLGTAARGATRGAPPSCPAPASSSATR